MVPLISMPPRVFRVLVAGDDDRVRHALAFFLDSFDDLLTIGEAVSPIQTVELCAQLRPDVVLVDFSESEKDWIDAVRAIARSNLHIPVVGLIGSLNAALVREMLQAGAVIGLQRGLVTVEGVVDAIYTAVQHDDH